MVNLIEYKAAADAAAAVLQTLSNKKDVTKVDFDAASKKLSDAVGAYNEGVALNVRETCLAQESPILFALQVGFQDVLRVKRTEDKSKYVTIETELVTDGAVIDIKALYKASVKAETVLPNHDARWVTYLPTVRKFFDVAVGRALHDVDADAKGIAIKKSEIEIKPDRIGRQVSILDIAGISASSDPFSITSLRDVLQLMADMMVGPDVFPVPRKYARALILVLSKFGKKYTIVTASESGFALNMYRVLSAAANGVDFTVSND